MRCWATRCGRDVAKPSPDSAIVLARDGEVPLGILHLGANEGHVPRGDRLSVAILPDAPFEETLHDLAAAALHDHRRRGGGPVELWVFGADRRTDHVAAGLGFEPDRVLWQLRIGLPCPRGGAVARRGDGPALRAGA